MFKTKPLKNFHPEGIFNPDIGCRTGVDVLRGKNVRKDENGFENFDDYFTDASNRSESSAVTKPVEPKLPDSTEQNKETDKFQALPCVTPVRKINLKLNSASKIPIPFKGLSSAKKAVFNQALTPTVHRKMVKKGGKLLASSTNKVTKKKANALQPKIKKPIVKKAAPTKTIQGCNMSTNYKLTKEIKVELVPITQTVSPMVGPILENAKELHKNETYENGSTPKQCSLEARTHKNPTSTNSRNEKVKDPLENETSNHSPLLVSKHNSQGAKACKNTLATNTTFEKSKEPPKNETFDHGPLPTNHTQVAKVLKNPESTKNTTFEKANEPRKNITLDHAQLPTSKQDSQEAKLHENSPSTNTTFENEPHKNETNNHHLLPTTKQDSQEVKVHKNSPTNKVKKSTSEKPFKEECVVKITNNIHALLESKRRHSAADLSSDAENSNVKNRKKKKRKKASQRTRKRVFTLKQKKKAAHSSDEEFNEILLVKQNLDAQEIVFPSADIKVDQNSSNFGKAEEDAIPTEINNNNNTTEEIVVVEEKLQTSIVANGCTGKVGRRKTSKTLGAGDNVKNNSRNMQYKNQTVQSIVDELEADSLAYVRKANFNFEQHNGNYALSSEDNVSEEMVKDPCHSALEADEESEHGEVNEGIADDVQPKKTVNHELKPKHNFNTTFEANYMRKPAHAIEPSIAAPETVNSIHEHVTPEPVISAPERATSTPECITSTPEPHAPKFAGEELAVPSTSGWVPPRSRKKRRPPVKPANYDSDSSEAGVNVQLPQQPRRKKIKRDRIGSSVSRPRKPRPKQILSEKDTKTEEKTLKIKPLVTEDESVLSVSKDTGGPQNFDISTDHSFQPVVLLERIKKKVIDEYAEKGREPVKPPQEKQKPRKSVGFIETQSDPPRRISSDDPNLKVPTHIIEEKNNSPDVPKKEAPRKSLIPLPTPCPKSPFVRRSSRTRIPPLAHWRNERIVYMNTTFGFEAVGINPGAYNELGSFIAKSGQRRQPGNKPTKKTFKNVHRLSIHNKQKVDNLQNLDLQDEDKNFQAVSRESLQWMSLDDELPEAQHPCIIATVFKTATTSIGLLYIRPSGIKPMCLLEENSLTLFVKFGKLLVEIDDSCLILGTDDTVRILHGSRYSVENLRNDEAQLLFFTNKNEEELV